MINRKLLYLFCMSLFLFLPGCDVIVGIFEAGFWTAIILVVLIVALLIFGYSKMKGEG